MEKKLVLLVDGDESICFSIKHFLEEFLGYKVFVAHDKKQAFDVLEKNAISIVLIDYWTNTGPIAAAVIPVAREWRGAKIILMSTLNEYKEIATRLEVDDAIKKPFTLEELSSVFSENNV